MFIKCSQNEIDSILKPKSIKVLLQPSLSPFKVNAELYPLIRKSGIIKMKMHV